MDKKIKKFQIFSTIFIFILGTLLHFVYSWSGENKVVALFSSVNESTWEHLKLLFFPMLITIIIGYFYIGKDISNVLCAKTTGIVVAILFTIVFFYTYTGVLGKNIAIIDIGLFFASTIIGEYVAYKMMLTLFKCNNKISMLILVIIFISFCIFTFYAPQIGLFKDPITGNYGIIK